MALDNNLYTLTLSVLDNNLKTVTLSAFDNNLYTVTPSALDNNLFSTNSENFCFGAFPGSAVGRDIADISRRRVSYAFVLSVDGKIKAPKD